MKNLLGQNYDFFLFFDNFCLLGFCLDHSLNKIQVSDEVESPNEFLRINTILMRGCEKI